SYIFTNCIIPGVVSHGIDIAKSVFQFCVWMDGGSVAWNKKISRSRLQDTFRQIEPVTLNAMRLV
ncbi:hypothetical protein ACSRCY_23345, partial [Salmonella enterica]